MVSVFGQEIPWGASKEEVDAKYSWLYEFEYTFGIDMGDFEDDHHLRMGFKDGLWRLAYVLWFNESRWVSIQLYHLEKRLDELDEMYGKPEVIYGDYGDDRVCYTWTTDRETIRVKIYHGTIFVTLTGAEVVIGGKRWLLKRNR